MVDKLKFIGVDSISRRFVLATMMTVICICMLVWSQLYFEHKLINLHQQRSSLLALSNELLQIRRHEKDFMMRRELKYLSLIDQRGSVFSRKLTELKPIVKDLELSGNLIDESEKTFQDYLTSLHTMVKMAEKIGFTENEGEQLAFRTAIHELEAELAKKESWRLQALLLQIRRSEKDFMLRKKMQYVSKVRTNIQRLELALQDSGEQGSVALLRAYSEGFSNLVNSYQTLGLNHEQGMQRLFRDASHQLENTLRDIENTVSPRITEKERQVQLSRLVVIVINIGLLLFLMINSFRSIKKAMLFFMEFFNQSKTDMSSLDIDKFNLQEFKTMAEQANEMIEARKNAEFKLKNTMKELSEVNRDLEYLASRDGLTQIPNRRSLDKQLDIEWHRALRSGDQLSLILIDVDHFKAYNDHYGHAKGDQVLIHVARVLSEYVQRSGDFAARYGGEEFLVILPNTNDSGAMHVAQDLVKAVEQEQIPHDKSSISNVITISSGVYSGKPERFFSITSWIANADDALYQAKDNGRNQAISSGAPAEALEAESPT